LRLSRVRIGCQGNVLWNCPKLPAWHEEVVSAGPELECSLRPLQPAEAGRRRFPETS
jgi:hypothetical protein